MLTLKSYQENAVRDLLGKSIGLLSKSVAKSFSLVFKAPTGAGKTVIMQEFLKRLSEVPGKEYSYVWLSIGDIAGQSKTSFEEKLEGSKLRFSELSDIRNSELAANEILFVNWEKLNKKGRDGEWKVSAMKDNERDENLPAFLSNAREAGREIILIVDESHRNLDSVRAQELILDFIKPKLQIEVSATPDSPDPDEKVSIEPEEVIAAGMIRKDASINEKIGLFTEVNPGSDRTLIAAAMAKQQELIKAYSEADVSIRPLVLIQLPSESEKFSDLDKTKLDHVEAILVEDFGITRENGRLAVWLSEDKTPNLDGIKAWDSSVDVLVFKVAIATGWDCPRAQILLMFREIKSFNFSIQTIGRILRTPEQKHYENALLDTAYVYTDLPKAQVSVDERLKQYMRTKAAVLKPDVVLPAALSRSYAKRRDYGDLGYSFYAVFADTLLSEVSGVEGDFVGNLQKLAEKIDTTVEFLPERLLSDGKIALDVDERTERIIETEFSVETLSELERTQRAFEDFCRRSVRPHFGNIARSAPIISGAMYGVLEGYFFGKTRLPSILQAIILCNKDFFSTVLEKAKVRYQPIRAAEISQKTEVTENEWILPFFMMFPESAEEGQFKRYAFDPAWITFDSEVERTFVREYLDNPNVPVKWWYKNGDGSERYFSIVYQNEGKKLNFYPDFIVAYEDGTIGIFDPKKGNTLEGPEARGKAEALHTYIADINKKGIKAIGGFVTHFGDADGAEFYVTENATYMADGSSGFKKLAQ